MLAADDTTFNRLALKAPLPVIAVFHAASCEASRASLRAVRQLARHYAGRLRVVTVDTDASPGIAEQLGVWALPSYLALAGGDELTRACGFLPAGLLRLLFELPLAEAGRLPQIWRPNEQQLEDEVLLPMLAGWGWETRRQHRCAVNGGSGQGVVDILVPAADGAPPLTLFENKRLVANDDDLRRAAEQARRYALALGAPSFVVAEPARAWVYGLHGERAALLRRFDAYALAADDSELRGLLLALAGA
jgi:hypothetical protein